MEKIVLFGTGSMASVLHYYLTHDSPFEVTAFCVDREYLKKDNLHGLPVVPFDEVASIYPPDEHRMLIAIGYVKVNRLRAERYYQAREMGYRLVSYVSSKATIWSGLTVGENCKISANTMVQPFAEIGNNVFIGSGSVIGHHTVIKDHCYLATNVVVAGSVTIEPYSFLGTGSIVRNKLTIAREAVIGAGAVILEDTTEQGVYMSQPAERLPIASHELGLR